MAELTQLERAIRILQRLSVYPRVTINDLYEQFERRESRRTIHRTLSLLSRCNIPLRIERGAHNESFYSLRDSIGFTPMMLTAEEVIAASLLSGFKSLFEGTKLGEDLDAVFAKLHQLFPDDSVIVHQAFGDANERVAFKETGRMDLSGRGQILRDLFTAITKQLECTVKYRTKKFRIQPYTLLFHQGALYAIVHQPKHSKWIYLSLTRISELLLSEKHFERESSFNASDFLKDNFGIWQEAPEDVVIRFSKTVRHSIEDRIWHPSQRFENEESGDLILHMHVGISNELVAWILRWGEHAEVLKTLRLRQTVYENHLSAHRRYKLFSQ